MECGVLALLFSVVGSAQLTTTPNDPDPELARAIGQAVLWAAQHYEQQTGKPAATVLVRFTGKPPDLEKSSPPAPGLNQYHYSFEVEAHGAPSQSKKN